MHTNHNHYFDNTTFIECHQKAREEGVRQAAPHAYHSADVKRAMNCQPGFTRSTRRVEPRKSD